MITDTFHGTIFPINFEIPFYSYKVSEGSRQGQILSLCDLEDRIIQSPAELTQISNFACDFTDSTQFIKTLREKSIEYLKQSLS